jgi:hypothetical protein
VGLAVDVWSEGEERPVGLPASEYYASRPSSLKEFPWMA